MKFALLIVLLCTNVGFSQISLFDSYSPNYFTSAFQQNELHAEFLVSLRYPRVTETKTKRPTHEIFGTYTGLYDFFVFTRPSSPVLSRLQNLKFALQMEF